MLAPVLLVAFVATVTAPVVLGLYNRGFPRSIAVWPPDVAASRRSDLFGDGGRLVSGPPAGLWRRLGTVFKHVRLVRCARVHQRRRQMVRAFTTWSARSSAAWRA